TETDSIESRSASHCIQSPTVSTLLSQDPPPPAALHSFPTRRSSDLHPHQRLHVPHQHRDRGEQQGEPQQQHELDQDPEREEHQRSEEHTSELQSRFDLVCRLLLEKKNI